MIFFKNYTLTTNHFKVSGPDGEKEIWVWSVQASHQWHSHRGLYNLDNIHPSLLLEP